jgi:hypothetical protein
VIDPWTEEEHGAGGGDFQIHALSGRSDFAAGK